MDSLTRSLIKDLLPESIDGKEVTAVFGGGFKPPTVGHLAVIQNALKDNPEIDNIIIYVGSKVRDGITQDQSFKIWDEHYKQLIDKPVRIEKSVSPIGDIYRYAKDNPEDSIYWVIGAREGREDDIQDISSRSISIDKYPNLNLKITSTPDGGMSGTNARQALMNGDKESFEFFIPGNANQDEIWNILTSQPLNEINQNTLGHNKLDESIVDNSIVCDNCGWSWKITDGGKDDLFICHKCENNNTPLNEIKPYKHKYGFDDKLGKDPFGLNQFAREIMQEEELSYDTFDYPKHIKSLTKFMLDKGIKLRPLPTVKFINDDVENAKDFFW